MAIGLPVKANYAAGDILTATNMNDLSGTFNNVATSYGNDAGKNKVINGDFGVWQRGTTFTNPGTTAYTADRWQVQHDGTGATRTISQQTFTPGTAPVAGYEGQYFFRYAVSGGTGNTFQDFRTNLEDVRTYAGETVTISFWAKADASRVVNLLYRTEYGSGGSSANQFSVGSVTITTAWVRYTVTYAVPSVSGLTIGTGSFGGWIFRPVADTAQTIDIWGVQIEAGSIATPFQTASGGSIQGELAMCQRYYVRFSDSTTLFAPFVNAGISSSTTNSDFYVPLPVTMRTKPSSVDFSTVRTYDYVANAGYAISAITLGTTSQPQMPLISATMATATAGRFVIMGANNSASAFLGFSAEL